MIAPDVVVDDLEPEGYALVCSLAEQRQRRRERIVSLLHDAGQVVHVVCTRDGILDGHREPFSDATARAESLLLETGADRVVLYDRSRTDDLAQELAAIPATRSTQLQVFWDNADAFWSSPAIATAPAPPRDPWRALPAILARAEDGWALLALYDGERCAATMLANVRDGLVRRITSLEAIPGAVRPARAHVDRLVEQVETHLGPVRLGLACDVEDMRAALEEDDVPAAVLRIARTRALWSRGIGGTA